MIDHIAVILSTAMSETNSPTWAIVMFLLGLLGAAAIAGWRMHSNRMDKAKDDLKQSEGKVSDTRHNELKTMISSVDSNMRMVSTRIDGLDGRVGKLERGHAAIKAHMGINANGEDPE